MIVIVIVICAVGGGGATGGAGARARMQLGWELARDDGCIVNGRRRLA